MLINEAAQQSGLTKKAVAYYLEQGLLDPAVQENGYRDFSAAEVELLQQIALYRSLGLSVAEIKMVLQDPAWLKPVLYRTTLELERERLRRDILEKLCQGASLADLAAEINNINGQAAIIRRLIDLFPGYYGKYISLNFARYLTGEIKTQEQLAAFKDIVDFLDNAPDLYLPADLQAYLDEYLADYSSPEGVARIEALIQAKERGVADIEQFMAEKRELIQQYQTWRQTEEFRNSPANRLMELMRQFCQSSGYYEKFIPAMRRLSPEYDRYMRELAQADERFRAAYPDYI